MIVAQKDLPSVFTQSSVLVQNRVGQCVLTLGHNSRQAELIIVKTIVLDEISAILDYKKVIKMTKKSKSWTYKPFKVSRLAFAHPVTESYKI